MRPTHSDDTANRKTLTLPASGQRVPHWRSDEQYETAALVATTLRGLRHPLSLLADER